MSLTDRQIAGNQRRSLAATRDKLLRMSEAWDGVDQYNMHLLAEAADKVEEVRMGLLEDADATGSNGNG